MNALVTLVTALAGLATPAVSKPPEAVTEQVRARASAAGFRGAILIGEADGSQASFTLGPAAIRTDSVWRWASITKQLAAVIAMQDVTRGRLDLDAPVSRYWPEWRAPNAARIRIRDLLIHRSGLPQPDASEVDGDGVPAFYRSGAAAPADSAAAFCAGPSRAALPAGFEYNNCDTIVLGAVLARLNGRSFEGLARQRLGRLDMRRFGVFRFGEKPVRHVAPTGEVATLDPMINLGVYGPSAGAYGTIQDLWRFNHALLSGRLLPAKAREQMWQSSRANGYYGFHQWIFPARLKGCAGDVRVVERQGLVGGIELRNFLLPESGRALILFSHHRPTNFGDPWEGKGLAFDLLSMVACR